MIESLPTPTASQIQHPDVLIAEINRHRQGGTDGGIIHRPEYHLRQVLARAQKQGTLVTCYPTADASPQRRARLLGQLPSKSHRGLDDQRVRGGTQYHERRAVRSRHAREQLEHLRVEVATPLL